MKALLKFDHHVYDDLIGHLLPRDDGKEQAAFVFAHAARSPHQVVFESVEIAKLGPGDFILQDEDYLEMTDKTRAWLIKRAHDLDASLVELHSHRGPWRPKFSPSDRAGLSETVPHMWWRLRKRPYLAIVIAKAGFDALLWLDDPKVPRPLDGLLAGSRLLKPTNLSLGSWG
jgi:hypothetical protein